MCFARRHFGRDLIIGPLQLQHGTFAGELLPSQKKAPRVQRSADNSFASIVRWKRFAEAL